MSFWSDFNETRGNRPGHKKNDPEGQWTQSAPELWRNWCFYVRPKSGFWPKNGSYPKNSPKMTFPPLIIWAKATFFFEQLFSVVARTWLGEKSGTLFLGQKFQFLAKKSNFCHTTPIFVDDPFLALDMTVIFHLGNDFSTFRSGVTAVSVKKSGRRLKKSSPLPPVGVPSASNSPSALSAQALRARALRARAGSICALKMLALR